MGVPDAGVGGGRPGLMRGRYAPSPTGALHLGNARTALVAWLSARAQDGDFVLRVEDLDHERTVPEAVTGNLAELRRLGLDWDEGPDVGGPHAPYRQSERDELYRAALQELQAQGRVFACFLSRKDLREAASAPHGASAVYGARQRRLNERLAEIKQREGKTPSLRFRVEARTLRFVDVLAGPQRVEAGAEVGDFVLRRADQQWAYQLAVVVDDIAMNITEVVRGDDLLPSTAAQLLLYEALGATPPRFLHVPLLLDPEGERMAKRKGSLTLSALQEANVGPKRVVGFLAYSLGLLPARAEASPAALVPAFHLDRLRREAYRLSDDDLAWLHS
ncbi:MAG TPA: tRNA glutamyl-Q(34) synthetase GluQRS [Trueperaceae bacterium]